MRAPRQEASWKFGERQETPRVEQRGVLLFFRLWHLGFLVLMDPSPSLPSCFFIVAGDQHRFPTAHGRERQLGGERWRWVGRGEESRSRVPKELQISTWRGPEQVNINRLPGLPGGIVQAEHCTRGIVEGVPFARKAYLFTVPYSYYNLADSEDDLLAG